MKYVDEFRSQTIARDLSQAISKAVKPERHYRLMEFCGGHTHAIFRYGISDLMPDNVSFIHGPGCPVCVLPIERIDQAIELAERHQVILCTYADMMRVPAAKRRSLQKVKAEGCDVRMIFSVEDALRIAQENPNRKVVFFAIGFETTTPPTAIALLKAKRLGLNNFSVFSNHVLTPIAMRAILNNDIDLEAAQIDGFLGPSHVSTIIGTEPYQEFVRDYQKPVVIAGFEPLDVMQSTLMLIKQLNEGRSEVENEYSRAVHNQGNEKAQALTRQVFRIRDRFEWRGLGWVPNSALEIRTEFADFDAEKRFELSPSTGKEVKGCDCPSILRGVKSPQDCKLFETVCTPENPMGSCMVSSEGACAAYWSYGRHRQIQLEAVQS